MAGKRVRCKQCGNVFALPEIDSSDAGPEDILAELEKSFSSLEGTGSGSAQAASANGEETSAGASVAPLPLGRTNVRFSHPFAKELDQYLPLVLTVGGLLWLGIETFQSDETGVGWIPTVRFVVAVLAYAIFVAPITLAMIQRAGRRLGYQMPISDRWRAFASYLPAFVLGSVMWVAGSGSVVGLVLGSLIGVVLASAALWLFFRLKPAEIAPSAAYAGMGFFVGLAIAGVILWGMNTLLVNVLISTKRPDLVPGSPLGQGFAWISPETRQQLLAQNSKGPHAAPKPQIPAPPPPPANTSVPSAEVVPAAPQPIVKEPERPAPEPAPEPKPVEPKPAPEPVVEPPPITSPIVASIDLAPIPGPFDGVIRPLTESPFLTVVRRTPGNSVSIELWESGDTWTHKASVKFAQMAEGNHYVLSPDGENLARIVTFPRLAAQIYSFKEARVTRAIDLDEKLGTPELVGFAGSRRLLIRWQRDMLCGLETADVTTGQRTRQIETPYFDRSSNTLAVGPGGLLVALTCKADNFPTLVIYNLESGRQLSRARITPLDPRWPVTPTGMAFSPDATKLAMLFEQNGNGLLLCYRVDRGQQISEHQYAEPLLSRDARQFTDNALAWMPDGKSWLLYGQGVFDTVNGRMVADLGVPNVETYRVISPDTVEVVGQPAPNTPRRITTVRLDMDKVASLVQDPKQK